MSVIVLSVIAAHITHNGRKGSVQTMSEQIKVSMGNMGNMDRRQALVNQYSGLISGVTERIGDALGASAGELNAVGTIGFIKAVNSFDEASHGDFAAYGVKRIVQEIAQYMRDKGCKA